MIRKLLAIMAALICCVVSLPAAGKPVVKIGIILPLTGNLAQVGEAFRDGAQMALEEIPANSHFSYQLIFEDDALESRKVATAAQKLINVDKVDALISTWSYGGTVVAPIAEKFGVANFATAWDPAIVKSKTSYLALTPPQIFLKPFLEGIRKKGWKKVWLVGMKESGSIFCLNEFKRLAATYGIEVAGMETFNFGEKDFRTFLAKAKAAPFDAFFINLATPEIDIFSKQMRETGLEKPFTVITGLEVVQDLHPYEGKWYVSDSYVPDKFAERLHAKYGPVRIYGVGNYYDLVKLIVFVCENYFYGEGKPTREGILSVLSHPNNYSLEKFPSVFGKIQFDRNHIINYPAQLLIIQQGRRVPIAIDQIP